ncbi:hypothetical protein OEZ86_007911 [Tetradesmus obliquus]|nr:hypothetical protein OEZ86_007911 [Tetradesmus obliquus]
MLAENGWHVFAGARADADLQQLAQLHQGITPVRLDVTSQQSIEAVQQQVQAAVGGSGLQLLVNNAGIGMVSPVEFFDLQDFKDVFEVNFMGAVATSQALIPLLRAGQQRGRIINISSVAGHLNMPVWSAYCSSKHALESFSECLRYELQQFGVAVVLVKPGPVATPIWQKSRDRSTVQVDPQRFAAAMEVYGDMMEGMREETKRSEEGAIPVSEVVAVIYEAATTANPKTSYHVGDRAALTYTLQKLLPEGIWEGIMQSYFSKVTQQAAQQQQVGSAAVLAPQEAAAAAAQQQGVSAEAKQR